MPNNSSVPTDLDDLLNFGGPAIEEQDSADPRFPFLLLIDTSHSTGEQHGSGDPDIKRINEAVATMYRKLKYPAHGDPLALTNHQVDLCVISYNTVATVAQKWSAASDLPDVAPMFHAGGSTSTGGALMAAYEVMLARLKRYKADGLPKCGMPYIIHMTDGEPNDVIMDNPAWRIVQARTKELTETARMFTLWNFVAPNGYAKTPRSPSDERGKPMSGADVLNRWLISTPVKPIGEGTENFEKLADFIVKTITAVSQQAGAHAEFVGGANQPSLINDAA